MKFLILPLLLIFHSQNAYTSMGMNTFTNDYQPENSSELLVKNMPKVRSQGMGGICYSMTTAALIDEANCVAQKVSNCAEVSDDKKVSSLDLTRFTNKIDNSLDETDRFSYEGVNFDGGSQSLTLFQALQTKSIVKESCAPLNQVLAKTDDPAKAQELELAMWKRFQDSYETFKKKSAKCVDCGLEYATAVSNDLKEEFNLKATNKDILSAFTQDSYSKFLDKLLIPDHCWDFENTINLKGSWSQKGFPESKDKNRNYDATLAKIKEVLNNKRPLSISFCTQTPLKAKSSKECGAVQNGKLVSGEGHAVVIKGYRKVCNAQNVCRDSVQIHNSWGEGWQRANNDGWVDAKELLDRTFYEDVALSWLEPNSRK